MSHPIVVLCVEGSREQTSGPGFGERVVLTGDLAGDDGVAASLGVLQESWTSCSAGVGRATFFRIYGTKSGLLREFNRRLTNDAERRLDALDIADVRAALGQVADAIVDAWRHAGPGHLGMARTFVQSLPHADPHDAHPELFTLVHTIVDAGIERGELPDTVPSELAASLALTHLTAPIAYTLAGRSTDTHHLAHTLLDQWYAGMTGGPGARARRTS